MNRPFPLLLLALAASGSACGPKEAAAPAKGPPRAYRVSVARVETRELSYAIEAVGTLEAYDVVTVPARVEGTLESLSFDEGDPVTTDQVLPASQAPNGLFTFAIPAGATVREIPPTLSASASSTVVSAPP